MLNYSQYANFCTEVYTVLNGRINTVIPSYGLTFDVDRNVSTVGSSLMCITNIYLHNILEIISKNNYSQEQIRGILILAVAHELSHIDQDIDFSRLLYSRNDYPYRVYIEASNNKRMLNYIQKNKDKLYSIFGFFSVPNEIAYHDYMAQVEALKSYNIIRSTDDIIYNQCKSIQDKILGMCNAIFATDIMKIYYTQRNIKNIEIKILNENRNLLREYTIIEDNVFDMDKDIIKEFSLVIQSNINVIRTSSIGFVNNTLNLILMLKGNNNAGISVVKLL